MDYDFSDLMGGAITKIEYGSHPIVDEYMDKINSAKDAYFEVLIDENQLKGWREFRRKTGQYDDPRLDEAKTLYYYLFSIGIGDIGISTFNSIDESQKNILKRFRNVFDLAYRRYADITTAETQAREAQIEAALEKVRAHSLAMQKSEELKEVISVVLLKLQELGMTMEGRVAGIYAFEENSKDHIEWVASPEFTTALRVHVPYFKSPVIDEFLEVHDEGGVLNKIYSRELKDEAFRVMYELPELRNNPESEKKWIFGAEDYSLTVAFENNSAVGIASFPAKLFSDGEIEILKRFARVFEQSYIRFLDLKKAESQAREAEIELALERVRAGTMAMQKSEDLRDVIQLVYEQFIHLNIHIEHTGFILDYKTRDDLHIWLADKQEIPSEITIPCFDSTPNNSIREAKEKGQDCFSYLLNFEEKNNFYKELFKFIPGVPEESLEYYFNCPGLAGSGVLLENVGLYIENFSGTPYTDEENNTLMRFGKVFQQTYTRFLDLQKAEAQAREAEIQLALERVRARTMAMHKSDELAETAAILFQQMTELGVTPERLNICLIKEEDNILEVWATDQQGIKISHHFNASLDEPTTGRRVYDAWKRKRKFIVIDLTGQELNDWIRYVREVMGMTIKAELVRDHRIHSVAFFSQGMILTTTPEPLPGESIKLLERFADVFNLTYRRFLDLQKAEAQTREAQIEAALERVRSRSLAMHKSEELNDVVMTLFGQMKELGIDIDGININLLNNDLTGFDSWFTAPGYAKAVCLYTPYFDTPVMNDIFNAVKSRQDLLSKIYQKEEKDAYFSYLYEHSDYKNLPDERKKMILEAESWHLSVGIANNIGISIHSYTGKTFSEKEHDILKRFAKVFNQSYRRFLDLQKAEAQTREAQIEGALERVRSRSMGMHNSDELKDVVRLLYKEFRILVTDIDSVNIQLNLDPSKDIHFWASVEEDIYPELYHLPNSDLPIFEKIYEAFNSPGEGFLDYSQNKEEKDAFFREVFKIQPVPPKRIKMIQSAEGMVMMGWFHKHSGIDILRYNLKRFSKEEKEIVKRFAAAFEQTYIRFLDLQKAEAQAREAVKQASLERVRGEIASMRTAEDLNRITPIIWRELKALEVPFIRSGVFIVDEANEKVQVFFNYSGW